MKKNILITIIGIIIIGIGYFGFVMFDFAKGVREDIVKKPKDNLILVENDHEIDLTVLDSVRENLNGFWISENEINGENIIWLDFHKDKNFATWEIISYTEEIERTEALSINFHSTFTNLFKVNGKVQIEFVNRSGTDTAQIEYLSKTKFKIDGQTYLRHKGYDFLKTWNVHGYQNKK